MTDTTKLLKYAEGLTLRDGETHATICYHGDYFKGFPREVRYDGKAGEVTKVLVEGLNRVLNRAMVHDNEGFEEIAKNALTRATAILVSKVSTRGK